MKKIFLLFILSAIIVSCKNSEEKKAEESTSETEERTTYLKDKIYKGEFIYLVDAAVFKGVNYIFGVELNEKAAELAERVKPIKNDEFDMVFVVVKGTVAPKPKDQEGWDQILTITEILEVSDTPAEVDVRIQENKS